MHQSLFASSDERTYPPLASLEAVRAVARHQSLTAAANELGQTAGALSRRVAAVETWLGTSLFRRHGRGMTLTPDGQRFVARVDEAFDLIASAGDPWRRRRGTDVVRISVVPSFARMWLLPRLRRLELGQDGSQELRAEIAIDYRHADLEGGEVDVAIRYGRGSWKAVHAERLMNESLIPVASPELAQRIGCGGTAQQILRQTLLCDSDAIGWRDWLRANGVDRFRPRAHDRRFEDYGAVLAAARAGLGVALARLPFAEQELDAVGLIRLSEVLVPSSLTYYIVTAHRESRRSVLEFCRRLRDLAGE